MFTKVMNEHGFTKSDALPTEGKSSLTSLLTDEQKEFEKKAIAT